VESICYIDGHSGSTGLVQSISRYSCIAPRVTEAIGEEETFDIHVPTSIHHVGLRSGRLRWRGEDFREHVDALALNIMLMYGQVSNYKNTTYLLIYRFNYAAHDCGLVIGRTIFPEPDLVAPEKIVRIDIDMIGNTYTIQNQDLPQLSTVVLVQ
jgi:hypothetical protein